MKKILVTLLFIVSSLFSFAQIASEEVLALQYFQNGDYPKALSIYEKLFNQSRDQLRYYDQYYNSLIKLKGYDAAEKLVKKMMNSHKGNFTFMVDYGRILRERGEADKANDWYNKLLKNLSKEEHAIRELSVTFYRAEAYDYSIKTLLAGRDLLNDEMAFSFDLLALYRYQKNKTLLIQEYLHLLSKTPDVQLIYQAKSAFSSVLDSPDDYLALRSALLRKIQKEPQNTVYSDLLAWQYIQQKEFDLALKQTIALDKRLKEDGERVYELTEVLISNSAYEPAIEGLEYLLSKGASNPHYVQAKMQILFAKNKQLISGKFSSSDLVQLENDYQTLLKEFGHTANTVFAIRQLASLQAFHLNKPTNAVELLEEALKIPRVPSTIIGQIKLELGDIYILTGEVWEAALIYGQAEKEFANEPIGQDAKFKNAKLSYYQGDFTWAKAQLDVLRSSTSQLIANDALNLGLLIAENTESEADTNALRKLSKADFLVFINQFDKAIKTLDSISVLYPQNSLQDDILMLKAKTYQKQNLTNNAIEQLNLIVTNHSADIWGDDALFMLAGIYESDLKDNAKAMEYYQKIITDFPNSLFITEARKRFRNLRGDNLG
ncbi:MAG TPA: tetratricopeptide repeat protein [Pedobacter sp.]|jgi:tetratricopeptide (TPR) repeat protein